MAKTEVPAWFGLLNKTVDLEKARNPCADLYFAILLRALQDYFLEPKTRGERAEREFLKGWFEGGEDSLVSFDRCCEAVGELDGQIDFKKLILDHLKSKRPIFLVREPKSTRKKTVRRPYKPRKKRGPETKAPRKITS